MIETFYLACEQFRPYAVFNTLKEAKKQIQDDTDSHPDADWRIVEVKSVAWHNPPAKGWTREECAK